MKGSIIVIYVNYSVVFVCVCEPRCCCLFFYCILFYPFATIFWRKKIDIMTYSVVVSALASINVLNGHWARLVLRAGKPSRYVTSHLGQLSLQVPSLRGR